MIRSNIISILTIMFTLLGGAITHAESERPKVPGPGEGGTGRVVPQQSDGQVILHARDCSINGKLLRFEPQPHKNTVGFWTNPDDYVYWKTQINQPGAYVIEVLQGCGTNQGGSTLEVSINGTSHQLTVRDTGHFQNFVTRYPGLVEFYQAGEYQLTVKALNKAKAAVADIRQVRLIPVKPGPYQNLPEGQSWLVDEQVYITFEFPPSSKVLKLPESERHITKAYFLTEDKTKRQPLTIDVTNGVEIALPQKLPSINGNTILALEVRNGKKTEQIKTGAIELPATAAKVHGSKAALESNPGNYRIGFWSNPRDTLSWEVDVKYPGEYVVEVVSSSAAKKNTTYELAIGDQQLTGKTPLTGSWYKYTTTTLGKIKVKKGMHKVTLTPKDFGGAAVMNLKLVLLRPVLE